ncbi:MAG: glycosyltransferase family 2 protein [Pyrobaculum arsenaticum]|uniref:Glycosyl transferase, family 2 n=2 Tax=Pyrobaculum arsenaticum TaxID=121277 RepID=A4WHV0_PYRAR|nr:glycosyltransferase family 2 protein [Pyrobaculum arsenaticum]ABP49967.1 glycosyl transferase, family 2 [Pyrobaculum arsenaticum DSM 13514]MCY0891543.1 glycosyltransferase family 2 protein [Pyrobaculum arsenaticum]NYR16641.1 glycosyltransferase family 2 protein [Pyrobaculum arsenaticum]
MLFELGLALAALHFGVPLGYYAAAKRWLRRDWGIKEDVRYTPRVTVIIPTYNEADNIAQRLENIYQQDYPRDRLEVIVADGASTDGTPEIAERWAREHPDLKVKLIREPQRRGLVPSLNEALKYVSDGSEIVIFADADALWPHDAISKIVKYFANPSIGAVSSTIAPLDYDENESTYRSYFNAIRVAESKKHSTPIHNAPLMAFRAELIRKVGLPLYTGNNDSTPASIIAFMGYRAILVDDVVAKEILRNQTMRKIRRAQHLILHFLKTKQYAKKRGFYKKSEFDIIWKIEWWLHIVNPWLLIAGIALLATALVLYRSLHALVLLAIGMALLTFKLYRVWIQNQLYLVAGFIRNLWNKDLVWEK